MESGNTKTRKAKKLRPIRILMKRHMMVKHLCYSMILSSTFITSAIYSAQLLSDSVAIDIPELSDYHVNKTLEAIEIFCDRMNTEIMLDWHNDYDRLKILPDENKVYNSNWYVDRVTMIYDLFSDFIPENNFARQTSKEKVIEKMQKLLTTKYVTLKGRHCSMLEMLAKTKQSSIFNGVVNGIMLGGLSILVYMLYRYDKEKENNAAKA